MKKEKRSSPFRTLKRSFEVFNAARHLEPVSGGVRQEDVLFWLQRDAALDSPQFVFSQNYSNEQQIDAEAEVLLNLMGRHEPDYTRVKIVNRLILIWILIVIVGWIIFFNSDFIANSDFIVFSILLPLVVFGVLSILSKTMYDNRAYPWRLDHLVAAKALTKFKQTIHLARYDYYYKKAGLLRRAGMHKEIEANIIKGNFPINIYGYGKNFSVDKTWWKGVLEEAERRLQLQEQQEREQYEEQLRERAQRHLILGTRRSGDLPVWLTEEDRILHMHVLGRSGSGKTKFLEACMRYDLDRGHGFLLIDREGPLYTAMVDYCVAKGYDDRVILLDPRDREWSVGINFLALQDEDDEPDVLADVVMSSIAKLFDNERQEGKPEVSTYLHMALQTMIENKCNFSDVLYLFGQDRTSYGIRDYLVNNLRDPELRSEWRNFFEYPKSEQKRLSGPVTTRLRRFTKNKFVKHIVNQRHKTLDFRQLMDDGMVLLCNFTPDGKVMSEQNADVLATLLVEKVKQAAQSRGEGDHLPFYFYLDEFHRYVSPDVVEGLNTLRKFNTRFILAHQVLRPFRDNNIDLYAAIMANATIKIVFSVFRDDAELIASELYRFDKEQIKHELKQIRHDPEDGTFVVKAVGHSTGETRSAGAMSDMPLSASSGILPFFADRHNVGEATTENQSTSEALVPHTTHKKRIETANITFETVEEQREQRITMIMDQHQREALYSVHGLFRTPIPMRTVDVNPVQVTPEQIQLFKQKVYERHGKTIVDAASEIQQRAERLERAGDQYHESPDSIHDIIDPSDFAE